MNEGKKSLHETCASLQQAYLEGWMPNEQDIAKQLSDISLGMLQDSKQALLGLMNYHKASFLKLHEVNKLHAKPFTTRLQFHEAKAFQGVVLRKGERLYVQGEQLYPITLHEDIGISDTKISNVLLHEGKSAYLFQPDIENEIPVFSYDHNNQQEFSLSFEIDDLHIGMPTLDVRIFLEGRNDTESLAICEYFASSHMKWHLFYEEQEIMEFQVEQEEQALRFHIHHPMSLFAHPLRFHASVHNTSLLPQLQLCNIYFQFVDVTSPLERVLVNEVAQKCDNFGLFDKPLSLFQTCYMRCDAIFTHRDSEIEWRFQQDILEYCAGSELIETHEYHTFMRKLPKRQLLYEVFADQVQLEYFNGEWVRIPNVLFQQADFSIKGYKHRIHFHNPMDIKPYTVGGEEAYWYRLVLTKAENCYQIPSHHHIPIFQKTRFTSSYVHKKYKVSHIQATSNLETYTLDEMSTRQLCLWKQLPRSENSLYVCFQAEHLQTPFRMYVTMKEEIKETIELTWYLILPDDKEILLNVEDHTKGFARSGLISLFFPKHCKKISKFEQYGYWIRIKKNITLPFYNRIAKLEYHCVFASAETIDEKEYLLQLENQEVHMEVEGEIHRLYIKEDTDWVAYTLKQYPTNNRKECYLKDNLLYIQKKNLIETFQDFHPVQVKIEYYQIIPTFQLQDNTTVFMAKSDERIARVHTCGNLIQKEKTESDEHLMKRIAFSLSHNPQIMNIKDLENYLPLAFLDIFEARVTACWKNNKNQVYIYILWKDLETSPFTQHLQNEKIQEHLLLHYPCDVYQSELRVKMPEFVYCDVTLRIIEENIDMDDMLKDACERFLHPVHGNHSGEGWGIGTYPSSHMLMAHLKLKFTKTIFLSCDIKGILQIGTNKRIRSIEKFNDLAYGITILREVHIQRGEGF